MVLSNLHKLPDVLLSSAPASIPLGLNGVPKIAGSGSPALDLELNAVDPTADAPSSEDLVAV